MEASLSMTAWTSGANKKTYLVDVLAPEFLAGGGPLEQLVGDGVSSQIFSFTLNSNPVSPSLHPLLDDLLFGNFIEPWVPSFRIQQ